MSTGVTDSATSARDSRVEQTFPTLTAEQVARIGAHGRTRRVESGEILGEPGGHDPRFYVVTSGRIEIVRVTDEGETVVRALRPGQFSGEINMISGRPAIVRIRVAEAGELIEMERDRLLTLVQSDGDLGEILMRAFLFRREELIGRGIGDTVLLGSNLCAGTLRVKEFLNRNGHPYSFIDLDLATDVQELLDRFHVDVADVPVVICRGESVLRNPSNQEIARCLGFNDSVDTTQVRDLVVIGAGPAGLAAAVYAASEGVDVLVIESSSPGGQAGSSSRIENYLGFPMGISGLDLTMAAYAQAQKFGAQLVVAEGARRLTCSRKPYAIELDNGERVSGRTLIIATGAAYRKPDLRNLSQFEGAGVYYAATYMESSLCRDEEVIVVGGGNSAGQAAVFLAHTARRVHVLVRADGLAESMSRYLIRRIEGNPDIVLHTSTEIVGLEGESHLQRVRWGDNRSGEVSTHEIRHVFVMAGAVPNTGWLDGCVACDANGFIKTGSDVAPEELAASHWPLPRSPHLLETSLPGVFAVGDVRAGSFKRVAPAVGEGAIAVALVHRALKE